MSFAAALSRHPVTADAIGEVIGAVLEHGRSPDLCALFFTGHHAPFVDEMATACRTLLTPDVLVGSAAPAVLGARELGEGGAALSLWAAWFGPVTGHELRLEERAALPTVLTGLTAEVLPDGATVLLLGDAGRFPAAPFLDGLHEARPDVAVVGGLVPEGPLLLDRATDAAAVAVVLAPDQVIGPVVSQGCRPIGDPFTVTGSRGNVVTELAGRPAVDALESTLAGLGAGERRMLRGGISVGIAVDERDERPGTGAFLVRSILGADRKRRALAVAGVEVPIGSTLQFHVRDADAAQSELASLLDGIRGPGALVFTCIARGGHLFADEHHDATTVCELLGTEAVAGLACDGELGPIAGRSRLHAFSAAILVLDDGSIGTPETDG